MLAVALIIIVAVLLFALSSARSEDKAFAEAKKGIEKAKDPEPAPEPEPKPEVKTEVHTVKDIEAIRKELQKKHGAQRTSKDGEQLTGFEQSWLEWRLRNDLPACIDCEQGDLLEGPSGGICINVLCSNKQCGSKFNICGPMGIDRITNASPEKPREMVSLGPHR